MLCTLFRGHILTPRVQKIYFKIRKRMHHPPTLHFQTQTYNFLKKRDKYARMTVLQKNKLMIYDEYTFHRFIYASAFCNRYL